MSAAVIHHTQTAESVLVIGGGLAGMYAAIAAWEKGAKVTVFSKGKVGASGNSLVAMSVHRFAPDAPGLREEYRGRFLASGAGEQIEDTASFFVERAASAMEKLREYGFPLEFRCLEEKGGEYPYLACCKPKRGQILTKAVRTYLNEKTDIEILEGATVCDIILRDNRAAGILLEKDNVLHYYPGRSVVLAAGGGGNIYAATSNTSDVTGDGYAMALRCGLPLVGMEFVQFYPYRIYSPGRADIFPDIFDHGAVFRNEKGERFMDCAAYPKKELENRDVVARAMYAQQEVHLDLTDCDMAYLERECPNIAQMHRDNPDKPLLLRPVAHFLMGGVPLRTDCSTDVEGLYLCGEVAGGLHGANRLAGSALAEAALFGPIAGSNAAAVPFAAHTEPVLPADYPEIGMDEVLPLLDRLLNTMWENAALLRTKIGLEQALIEIKYINKELCKLKPRSMKHWIQLRNMLLTSEQVVKAALARPDSLGSHCRTD